MGEFQHTHRREKQISELKMTRERGDRSRARQTDWGKRGVSKAKKRGKPKCNDTQKPGG